MEKSETTDDANRPWQSYHTVYTSAKAGMDGVDKEKVQRIVYEMSKGSKYFENEERKEAFIRQKIEHMRARCAKLTAAEISHYQKVADKKILELETTRDIARIWLHVDMDAFYAAVETLSNPSLKGKPMAVGSMSMISTANYEARKFGVRAAMPGFIARKLCPDLIFVPTDFKKYAYYSDLTRKVFQKYDINFIATSLDEAYLDITEVCRERGLASGEIAEELRSSIYEETGLTCSAGVAPNRMLAKVCSDINKPNGQFILPNDRMAVMTFISSLPIRKIGGIGKVTEHILRDAFGITTCEELLQKSSLLCALFSHSTADFFLSVGLGLGKTDTPPVRSRKSISNERTFSATEDETVLYQKLAEIAKVLSADVQEGGLFGRTLTLKMKTASFEVRTRAVTLQKYICSFSTDKHETCHNEFGAPVEGLTDLDGNYFTFRSNAAVVEESHEPSGIENVDRVSDKPKVRIADDTFHIPKSFGKSEMLKEDLNLRKVEYSNHDVLVENADDLVSGAASTSNQSEPLLLWIDGYKCSLCGMELPPYFVEERQEHSDFHLAKRLQMEESAPHSRAPQLRQRSIEIDTAANQGKRKKQKSSSRECRYVPIDMFFVKSNQNFSN
ncbi:DNA polymerase kappa [Carica papaya]|uniref:DNA polymerase kappa n=1 Tax=Carica papaya TaxID=3649 RepID=UPI000B8D01A3|nr:DNA polymerase kappa [Carica papaya]